MKSNKTPEEIKAYSNYKSQWVRDTAKNAEIALTKMHKTFTIEQLRVEVEADIDPALDNRWWGQVTRNLSDSGLIKKLNDTAAAVTSNYSQKPLWERV